MSVMGRLKHAFNVFFNLQRPEPFEHISSYGTTRTDRTRLRFTAEKTILASILTRMAIDVAGLEIKHVKLDDQGRFDSEVNSGLNQCLTVEANIDQAARHFRQDIASSLFDEGVIALVPIDTTVDPRVSGSFDIQTMRIGKIIKWSPEYIRVQVYNDQTMMKEEVTVPKRYTAIIENPLYAVMNEQNSTLQRLIRKLNLLDVVDEQSSSGKLDLIIQLPYTIKSDLRRQQADQRLKDIELQMKGSQYGIAYTDGTEKVVQLNRPAENNLLKQVEFLMELLYTQLGITKEVMAGTAAQPEMLNYHNRTIRPIMDAIVEAMKRSFLTKTARTQGHSIMYFYDPFSLIPVTELAEIADKFTRNEIMSSNEMRAVVGRPPVKDKKADQLRNSNMPESELGNTPPQVPAKPALKLLESTVPS